MRRPFIQLLLVFLILGIFAWWVINRVALPPSLFEFLTLAQEPRQNTTGSPQEQEQTLMEKILADLPPPPSRHSPEVTSLLLRLKNLPPIPRILSLAVERDRQTPKSQTPTPWSQAELESLQNYQKVFDEVWDPFLSGSIPDWENFPDSALLFRSQISMLGKKTSEQFLLAHHQPGQPGKQSDINEENADFLLRFLRQTTNLGTLNYGSLSSWELTDTLSQALCAREILEKLQFSFSPNTNRPEGVLSWAPPIPSVASLRQGLKTDRAVFLRAAEYLDSLPAQTPAPMALTRLLGNQSDAEWFVSHVQDPKTAHDLALIIRQGAEQISTLEQKTYLSGPAWRQWTTGNPEEGLGPALRGSLQGMINFEETQMQYQVGLAFVKAASAYRQSGFEGMKKIPDPARPGSFLSVTSTTNEITISSAYQVIKGENFSFSFEPEPSP